MSVCPAGGEYGSEGGKADSSPSKVFETAEELRLLIEASAHSGCLCFSVFFRVLYLSRLSFYFIALSLALFLFSHGME